MNIIPNGTEVLIFKYFRERGPYQDDENYIYGIIKSSRSSDDLSYHGTSWYEQIYEVLGEDGKRYVGTCGRGLIGNSFFRTKEDHIKILKCKICDNEEEILKLNEINHNYVNKINELENRLELDNPSKPVKVKQLSSLKY